DCINWSQQPLPSTQAWDTLGVSDSHYCTIAGNTNIAGTATAVSVDGVTWNTGSMPAGARWNGVAWDGSKFCAVQTGGSNLSATSTDCVTWTAQTMPSSNYFGRIVWNGTTFCTIGLISNVVATSPDGITWTLGTLPASEYWNGELVWNGSSFTIM